MLQNIDYFLSSLRLYIYTICGPRTTTTDDFTAQGNHENCHNAVTNCRSDSTQGTHPTSCYNSVLPCLCGNSHRICELALEALSDNPANIDLYHPSDMLEFLDLELQKQRKQCIYHLFGNYAVHTESPSGNPLLEYFHVVPGSFEMVVPGLDQQKSYKTHPPPQSEPTSRIIPAGGASTQHSPQQVAADQIVHCECCRETQGPRYLNSNHTNDLSLAATLVQTPPMLNAELPTNGQEIVREVALVVPIENSLLTPQLTPLFSGFDIPNELQDISLFQRSERLYTCTMCGYRTRNSSNYTRHVQKYSKDRKIYTCPTCDKIFPTKFNMDRHCKSFGH